MFRVERECHCVIDDVLFLWDRYKRVFKWYDSKSYSWKDLIGIEGLPELSPDPQVCQVEMVDLGGKIGFCGISICIQRPIRSVGFGVLRLRLRDAMEMRCGGKLSGLILCLEPTSLVLRSTLFLLLFDLFTPHENMVGRLLLWG